MQVSRREHRHRYVGDGGSSKRLDQKTGLFDPAAVSLACHDVHMHFYGKLESVSVVRGLL